MKTPGLAHPYYEMKDRYDVVVVGSGYGASIAASRMSRAGYSVCILERGKEYLAKDFPDNIARATTEIQIDAAEWIASTALQNPLGLYNFHLSKDLNVLVGCGLGGTSLINANVAIKPDPRIFEDSVWPEAIRKDSKGIQEAYDHAFAMLKPSPYPVGKNGYPELPKVKSMFTSGKAMFCKTEYTDINVNFEYNGDNHVGIHQEPCNNCGDCCSGCRYHAKNTLDKNYLPDARNHGAHIFTQMQVQHIEKCKDGSWLVHYIQQPGKPNKGNPATSFIRAKIVVLGAGSLGSTEILARSKEKGLAVSDYLGKAFTGNGDVLAFAYNTDKEIRSIGFGKDSPASRKPVGPCITSVIDLRQANKPLEEGMIIEEGVIPGALGATLPKVFSAASHAFGEDTDQGVWDETKEQLREVESLARGFKYGATNNTQTYLAMSHDGSKGKLYLKNGKITVDWPGYADLPGFKNVAKNLKAATTALGGIYIENPITEELLGNRLITVHPLGGCSMGDNRNRGVVDHRCEVFDASSTDNKATHAGLYVMDGAAMPRSLGVNPLFTICAVAERAAAIAVQERGKKTSYDFPKAAVYTAAQSIEGVTFTEIMRGFITAGAADFQSGFDKGKAKGEEDAGIMFRLTVTMNDIKRFVANHEHLGSLTGYVVSSVLSDKPLSVSEGKFNLFIVPSNDTTMRQMVYRMVLTSWDGKQYYFEGKKFVRHDEKLSVAEIWTDTSTLYVTIWEGTTDKGKVVAKGIQKILVPDFIDQLKTANATNIENPVKAAAAVAEFGKFFFQQLWETYITEGQQAA